MIVKALDRRSGEPRLWKEKNQLSKAFIQLELISKALWYKTIRFTLQGVVMIIVISVCFLLGYLFRPFFNSHRHYPKAK
jgi:hypothetical protein